MIGISAYKPRSNKVNKGKWYHSRNNAVAWQDHQPAYGQGMKGDMGRIKKKKEKKESPHPSNV